MLGVCFFEIWDIVVSVKSGIREELFIYLSSSSMIVSTLCLVYLFVLICYYSIGTLLIYFNWKLGLKFFCMLVSLEGVRGATNEGVDSFLFIKLFNMLTETLDWLLFILLSDWLIDWFTDW